MRINTNFLFLAGMALSLGCIIISWSQLSKTKEITNKFQKILKERGYSKKLYKQERRKYNLSLISYHWLIGITIIIWLYIYQFMQEGINYYWEVIDMSPFKETILLVVSGGLIIFITSLAYEKL